MTVVVSTLVLDFDSNRMTQFGHGVKEVLNLLKLFVGKSLQPFLALLSKVTAVFTISKHTIDTC